MITDRKEIIRLLNEALAKYASDCTFEGPRNDGFFRQWTFTNIIEQLEKDNNTNLTYLLTTYQTEKIGTLNSRLLNRLEEALLKIFQVEPPRAFPYYGYQTPKSIQRAELNNCIIAYINADQKNDLVNRSPWLGMRIRVSV